MGGSVLIIDDSIVVLGYVETVLAQAGHSVVIAEDWSEVRTAFKDNDEFHVVLVDVNLPGMRSGDHLAKSLRKHPKAQNSKIVFFSAESGENLEKLMHMSGIDGYITKGQGDDKFLKDVESFMPPEVFEVDKTVQKPTKSNPFPKKTTEVPAAKESSAPKKSWWTR